MTPNPNPSPELRAALSRIEGCMNRLIPNLSEAARGIHTSAIAQAANDFADLRAALSPQTLPAPGEVEQGTGWVAWNPDSGEEYTPNHPVESGECVEAERIRRSTPQEDTLWTAFQEQFMRAEALATVAAANDEGVARIIDPIAWQERERLLERKAEWESRPAIEGIDFVAIYAADADRVVEPSLTKAAAIRLLSQGWGK